MSMLSLILGLVLILISLGAIDVLKSYKKISTKELKKRAADHDPIAEKIYQVAAYESSLDLLMYLIISICFSLGFIILVKVMPGWLSFFALLVLLLVAFVWLPNIKVTRASQNVGFLIIGPTAYLLNLLHPTLQKIIKFVRFNVLRNEKIYDQKDLISFLDKLLNEDNIINRSELIYLANSAKAINDKVSKIYTPWKKLKFLYLEDSIGPVVLDELHKHNQKIVPILNDKKEKTVVGLINIERLDVNRNSSVRNNIEKSLFYLSESSSIIDALISFSETNYPSFIVLDEDRNYKGLLSLDNLMNKLLEGIKVEASNN